jgi:hypothetical protein
MRRLGLVIFLSCIDSFTAVLISRGLYFYAEHLLGFTGRDNLQIALMMGAVYVVAALTSERLSKRLGERRQLVAIACVQLSCFTTMLCFPRPWALVSAALINNVMLGLKWPVVQSYLAAGRTPSEQASAIGRFNLSWAAVVPLSLLSAGPFVEFWPPGLYVTSLALGLLSLGCLAWFPCVPEHLPHDHPGRMPESSRRRLAALLACSRWTMLTSYAMIFMLNPLYPTLFREMGLSPAWAAGLAAGVDLVRFVTFAVLQHDDWWHDRAWPLLASLLLMPVGFGMVRLGDHLAWVVVGEVIIGAASGVSYFASLYYAMVVSNASVDAAGRHEAMIGSGVLFGPAGGLAANLVAQATGSVAIGAAAGVGPLVLAGVTLAVRPLLSLGEAGDARPGEEPEPEPSDGSFELDAPRPPAA